MTLRPLISLTISLQVIVVDAAIGLRHGIAGGFARAVANDAIRIDVDWVVFQVHGAVAEIHG